MIFNAELQTNYREICTFKKSSGVKKKMPATLTSKRDRSDIKHSYAHEAMCTVCNQTTLAGKIHRYISPINSALERVALKLKNNTLSNKCNT